MTSHCRTLLSTSPQLMPGMSLSLCICLSCLPRRPAAGDVGMFGLLCLMLRELEGGGVYWNCREWKKVGKKRVLSSSGKECDSSDNISNLMCW